MDTMAVAEWEEDLPETKIEWCDFTFNCWVGCQKVSTGCDRCFAESWAKRSGLVKWGPHAPRRRTSETYWKQPIKWNRAAAGAARRPRVSCASLADVFDNQVDPTWRADLFRLIIDTPNLDWLLLTKRPENVAKMMPDFIDSVVQRLVELAGSREAAHLAIDEAPDPAEPPKEAPKHWPNVWLGFTAEDQEHFDRRWPIMQAIPAAIRFCSYEPAIGPLRLPPTVELMSPHPDAHGNRKGLHWLICGGESGAGHRPMRREWEVNIRIDCDQAGISYFFKQMSGKAPIPDGMNVVRQFPATV